MPEFDSTVSYRPIKDYPMYLAGSDGSVWSVRGGYWRQMHPSLCKDGYLIVSLRNDAHRKTYKLHRIICETFHGPRPSGMECRHFPDRNRRNCAAENLSWGTKVQNMADKIVHGTYSNVPKGSKSKSSKITEDDAIEMRRLYAEGWTQDSIAEKFKVARGLVQPVVARTNWKHVGGDLPPISGAARSRGSMSGMSKLNEEQVREMRLEYAAGKTQKALGEKYGMSESTIHFIVTRKTWKHVA